MLESKYYNQIQEEYLNENIQENDSVKQFWQKVNHGQTEKARLEQKGKPFKITTDVITPNNYQYKFIVNAKQKTSTFYAKNLEDLRLITQEQMLIKSKNLEEIKLLT